MADNETRQRIVDYQTNLIIFLNGDMGKNLTIREKAAIAYEIRDTERFIKYGTIKQ